MIFHLCKEPITHETEGFPVAYYSVDEHHPRYRMMHHWHPETELIRLNAGSLTLTLDETPLTLKEGEFVLIPSGTVHSGIPKNCNYECIVFNGTMLTGMLQGNTKKAAITALSQGSVRPETEAIRHVTEALRKRERGYQTDALSALFSLLGELIRTPTEEQTYLPKKQRSRLIPFEQSILYLQEHYKEPIALKDLADAAGLSEKYFGEYFKNITGESPIRYLNGYRIARAAEQLQQTDAPVTEIALKCGFNDLSYFIKTFRTRYGVAPGNYRKQQK